MRAVRPRRLGHVVPFAAAAEAEDLTDTFSRLSACSFMVMVCDFSVTWICGTPVQFTSVIVPTMEYILDDSAKSGGAGDGCVFGVADAVDAADRFASGSVLRSIRGPESGLGPAGVLLADAGGVGGRRTDIRAARSPALSAAARALAES